MKARLDSLVAAQARAALAIGPLVRHRAAEGSCGIHWRYRRRLFSADLVSQLIAAGEALRDGDTVRMV